MGKLIVTGLMSLVLVGCGMPLMNEYRLSDEYTTYTAGWARALMACADAGHTDMAQSQLFVNTTVALYDVAKHDAVKAQQGFDESEAMVLNSSADELRFQCGRMGAELPRVLARLQGVYAEAVHATRTTGSTGNTTSTTYTPPPLVIQAPSGDVTFGEEASEGNAALINTPSGQKLCTQTGSLINCQ